jgi:hypothetical protein
MAFSKIAVVASTLAATAFAQAGFEVVYPPANAGTDCIDGDFAFFVRKGGVNKVVIDFEGGGACWDAASCAMGLAKTDVNVNRTLLSLNSGSGVTSDREESPFKDWTYVFVPYCTGDVFMGNQVAEYGTPHLGFNNAMTAYNYVLDNVAAPESTVTTGCSAGGYGAHFWGTRFMGAYPNARNYHFADSAMAVIGEGLFVGLRDNWNLQETLDYGNVPEYENLNFDTFEADQSFTVDLISMMSRAFPLNRFVHFTSNADIVQAGFYAASGGSLLQWTNQMRSVLDRITSFENNAAYITPGAGHCIIPGDSYFSTSVEGVNLASWINSIFADEPYQPVVDCAAEGSC